MKRILSTLIVALAITNFTYAQWTSVTGGIQYIDGNVGIGPGVPLAKLVVISDNVSRSIEFGYSISLAANYLESINRSGGATPDMSYYLGGGNANHRFYTNGIERIRLDAAGNFGIGTVSPASKLDVQGGNASIYNTGNATSLVVGSTVNTKTYMLLSTSADASGYVSLQSVSASGSLWGNTIINQSGGFVGIGTTTPREALSVNGNIRSKQIKVETNNWPDYVFKPTYNLPLLSDLKIYIDKHQKLPDMPSEVEVVKDGLNLGEIIKLQMRKIEESTLYAIEQQRKIDQLEKQQSDTKRLEARIAALELVN